MLNCISSRDVEVSNIYRKESVVCLTSCIVIHAEMPVHEEGKPEPRGLQLWVDLPKQFKMVEPSYQELGPKGSGFLSARSQYHV